LVPQEFAERLLAARGKVGRERRVVTILFSDVMGSTALAEGLDPEDVMEIMDGAFDVLIAPVYRHEGTLARMMGDAILAFFGAPIAHEDDPERAIRAALDIVEGTKTYARQLARERGISGFNVRVGINTGLVVVGEVGTDLRVEYTAMGDAINLAARMEQHAPPGGILVSHDTYCQVRGVFDVQPQEPVQVKGKQEPVQTYLVQRARPRAFRRGMRGVEGVETRMIDREAELEQVQHALHRVMENSEPQILTISGEAGVGKSRLLYEFENWADLLLEHLIVCRARASQGLQKVPYALIRDLFTSQFQIQESDRASVARAKMERGIGEVLAADPQSQMKAHLIGQLIGLDFTASPHLQEVLDDARQLRDRAITYMSEFFRVLAASSPMVLLLEDIHWSDDSSLDLLEHLASTMADQPLLIVCVARPTLFERRPAWGAEQTYHTRLRLHPLSPADSHQLVEEILQKAVEVPEVLSELLVNRSEGNPYYIEELIRNLVEDGAIVKGDETWHVKCDRLGETRIPPTLTGLLQARIDRLDANERLVLQQAAVVGRVFWDSAVAMIRRSVDGGESVEEISAVLSSLQSREMISRHEEPAFSGAREYSFQHTVLREVVYESVLRGLRQKYHGIVAQWLIEESADRIDEFTGQIADHLEASDRALVEEAIPYLLKAGDRARRLYAHREAVDRYQRALALLKEQGDAGREQAARTLMKLGLVYTAAFEPNRAQEAYDEAFTLWEPLRESRGSPELRVPSAVLRLAVEEPLTLDPGLVSDDVSMFIAAQLFEGLVEIDPDYNVLPAVAARWDVADDGTRYVFRLREGLRWSDGTPLTAGDFEYAWKRNLSMASLSPLAHLLHVVKGAQAFAEGEIDDPEKVGVVALDELTLEVRLEGPTAYLPYLLAHPIAFPLPRWVVDSHGQAWTDPDKLVSNAAYRMVEWRSGGDLVLSRNPFYGRWFPGNAERVECAVFTDFAPVLQAYAADALDAISMLNADPGTIALAQWAHGSELAFTPQPSTFHLVFRADRPPFDDVRVRRAFAHALDRVALAREASKDQYAPATGGFVPPGMPGHSAGIGLAYDPELARGLLAEAGFPGGQSFPRVSWIHSGGSAGEPIVPFMRRAWRTNLGLDVEPESLEWGAFMERLNRNQAHLTLVGWFGHYPDPDSLLRVPFHSTAGINIPRWKSSRFDALVEEAVRVVDQTKRMELYQEADRILVAEEAVVAPLGYAQGRIMMKPWVTMRLAPPVLMRLKHVVLRQQEYLGTSEGSNEKEKEVKGDGKPE
jgi:ABC-type oligopeptide transport system substrate-binding subunit/class 3 adenylate cyclase